VLFYIFLCFSIYCLLCYMYFCVALCIISFVLCIFVLFYVLFLLFYVFLCCSTYSLFCSMYFCVVLCSVCFVTFPVLFVCICVHCTTVTGWLPNCSYIYHIYIKYGLKCVGRLRNLAHCGIYCVALTRLRLCCVSSLCACSWLNAYNAM
jgi:hypothetical protein